MTNEFSNWLSQHGLSEVFTTSAGDALYVNREKKFGVIRKNGQYGAYSFYLDDIVEFKTYDDEILIAEWNCMGLWRVGERKTYFSTNEVYMNIRLKNQLTLKLQLFKATHGNVKRDSYDHVRLFDYAMQISQIVYRCANGL